MISIESLTNTSHILSKQDFLMEISSLWYIHSHIHTCISAHLFKIVYQNNIIPPIYIDRKCTLSCLYLICHVLKDPTDIHIHTHKGNSNNKQVSNLEFYHYGRSDDQKKKKRANLRQRQRQSVTMEKYHNTEQTETLFKHRSLSATRATIRLCLEHPWLVYSPTCGACEFH